jgi:hypothetical protein
MRTFAAPNGVVGPPAVCSPARDRLELFAVGGRGLVYQWSLHGSTWSGPHPLLQGPVAVPAGVGISALAAANGRIDVFAVDSHTRAPAWWRFDRGFWMPPVTLAREANLHPTPVSAVATSATTMDVFAVGAGNGPWWWHFDGSNWAPRAVFLGNAGLHPERVAAVCTNADTGQLNLFAAGAGNQLWHWQRASARAAAAWTMIPRGGNLPRGAVSAVSWGPGRVDVFAAAAGNLVQHWWPAGVGFGSDQMPVPPRGLEDGGVLPGSVTAVSYARDRLDVFGITPDGRIAHWEWDGARWHGPDHHGSGVRHGELSAVARVNPWPNSVPYRRLDVFGIGAGNTAVGWPGSVNTSTRTWTNWPTNRSVAGATVVRPDSLEELVGAVVAAERQGSGVRAVGSGWSNSDAAVTNNWVVETDQLDGVLTQVTSHCLNPDGRRKARNLLHVEGGMKLWQLNALLDSRTLAVPTMGGSSGQSIAGLLSTSAHGCDVDRGPIPEMVRGIHLVGPGGAQHWIEPSHGLTDRQAVASSLGLPLEHVHYDDDWFSSALVAVGSLGVMYSLLVEAVPQYDLNAQCDMLDWDRVTAALRGGPGTAGFPFRPGNRAVQIIIDPYAGATRACFLTTRRHVATHTVEAPADWVPPWLIGGVTLAILQVLRLDPGQIPGTVSRLTRQNQLGWQFDTRRNTVGISHTMMGRRDPGPNLGLTVEAVFDATWPNTRYLDFTDAALQLIADKFNETPRRGYLGWISMRFQGASRAYLSPQHRPDAKPDPDPSTFMPRTVTIEFAALWRIPLTNNAYDQWNDTAELIPLIEAKAREFGGGLHWGMNDAVNAIDTVRTYPRLDTWRRIRSQLTRSGTIRTFDNALTRRCGLSDHPLPARPGNFTNDKLDDLAVFRPRDANWYLIDSATGAMTQTLFGTSSSIPVHADYTGDGKTEFAVWDPYTATWSVQGGTPAVFGKVGDIPVPGDYDGDGAASYAVWRPENGTWYFQSRRWTAGRPPVQWGQVGDVPVPSDYDGDGVTDLAVWRPGDGVWYVITSGGTGAGGQWGQAGDIPVPADYDGDGRVDLAVWRPSDGRWYVIESSTGRRYSVQWGEPGDIPVPGRYTVPFRADFAVWRPRDGMWHIKDSHTGATRSRQWGLTGDIPV